MKLKEYLEVVNKLLEENPEHGELEVIYSHDDEGNAYQIVNNTPTLCMVGDLENEYFLDDIIFDGEKDFYGKEVEFKPNAICIN